MKTIYFAGGCFWGTEHYMGQFDGVAETVVGYANGHVTQPSYQQVYTDQTGHVECVRVTYDESVVALRTLCRMFFRSIDPLLLNRQGEDVGTRYRTGIYWTDEEDRAEVEQVWQAVQDRHDAPLAVECLPLQCFYPAEDYHQDYLYKNPDGYCHLSLEILKMAKDYSLICKGLRACAREDKREIMPRFFKTGKGEYGEGDMFLGVVVPDTRKVAKAHKDVSLDVVEALLESQWHECRLCALLVLVERFKSHPDEVT
jgi:peptide methionine sulfoxide reductase msrA/msrB